MVKSSTPHMGAHDTDVIVNVNVRFIFTSAVIASSLLLLHRKKKLIMVSPKTHKVILPDGREARAVKLRYTNVDTVLSWIPGSEFRERVGLNGVSTQHRIMVPVLNKQGIPTSRFKAAYYDDWVVKVDGTFFIVKFDKVDESLFFPNAFEENKVKRAHTAWKKEFGHE
jgi:hypothetical protein